MAITTVSIDPVALEAAYAAALGKIPATEKRWVKAVQNAYEDLAAISECGLWVEFSGDAMLVPSSDPKKHGVVYRVTTECQCEAASNGKPCRHVCRARLVKRMQEIQAARAMPVVRNFSAEEVYERVNALF